MSSLGEHAGLTLWVDRSGRERAACGRLCDSSWDPQHQRAAGTLELNRTEAGEWVRALLLDLERKGRLGALGIAVEMDGRFEVKTIDGRKYDSVTEILRGHAAYLVHRSAAGGGFRVPFEDEQRSRGDVDRRVGLSRAGTVTFLADPVDLPWTPRDNGDGSYRLCTLKPLSDGPGPRARFERFASTIARSGEEGAILGREALDRADAIERVDRTQPPVEPKEAEEQARQSFALGVSGTFSLSRAVKRLAGSSRRRLPTMPTEELPSNLDDAEAPTALDQVLQSERQVALVRATGELRDLYRSAPAKSAALEYIVAAGVAGKKPSRAALAKRFETTPKSIRVREPGVRKDLQARLSRLRGDPPSTRDK